MGKKVVSLRVDEETWAEAVARAKALGLTQAAYVERALKREGGLTQVKQPDKVEAVRSQVPGLQRASTLAKDEEYFAKVTAWNRKHGPGQAA
jgi:hypothetical protein